MVSLNYIMVTIVIMSEYTTISVSKKTKHDLEHRGNKGETWDALLQKLMQKEENE